MAADPKKKRKKSSKGLKDRTHNLWSKLVRARDVHCVLCGKRDTLQAHHWIVHSRGSLSTRYLLENGVTLCSGCHLFKVHARGDRYYSDKLYAYMVPRHLSEYRYEKVKIMGNTPTKVTDQEIKDIHDLFKDKLEALER